MPRRDVVSSAQVVDVAARLVAARGPDGARLLDVARACGVAVGTLYRHFPGKEHLLAAVADRVEQQFVTAMQQSAPAEGPLRPALPALAVSLLEVADRDPLVRVLLRDVPEGAAGELAAGRRIRHWIAERVEAAQRSGEVGPVDPAIVAELAYGLVRAGLPHGTGTSAPAVAALLAGGLAGLLPPRSATAG